MAARLSVTGSRPRKRDNSGPTKAVKIGIRRRVMDVLGEARVFDAYGGAGVMHDAVWKDAALYVGCDRKFYRDERRLFVADNRRVLRAIDLSQFNLFDLDAYGSPWEQIMIIAARRRLEPNECMGITLTDGSTLALKFGGMCNALKQIAGVSGNPAGLARESDGILDAAVAGLAKRLNAEVERQWRAIGTSGSAVRYMGLVLRGREAPPEVAVQKTSSFAVLDGILQSGDAWTDSLLAD